MNATNVLKQIIHFPRRIVRESLKALHVIQFFLINRISKKPVTEQGGPVVSMTTYGARSQTAYLAIESIARGTARPSRLILWIDEEELFRRLPATIRRLQMRGLEVRWSQGYGSHTKYYPYIESENTFREPLVTADDDVLYPRYWLRKLIDANREYPENVNCYWAFVMETDNTGIGRYATFKACSSTLPSTRNIALGVMGVIYPPPFLMILKRAGTAFRESCPQGDDLWLHVHALRAGFRVRQVLPKLPYFSFQAIPGSQQMALSYDNVTYGDGNDRQVKATYTEADVRLLQSN